MNNKWAAKEFELANIGDERLRKRLIKLSEKFINSPESPINQACETWKDTKAAYRFFQNNNIEYPEITKSHAEATKNRCTDYSTILAIQDTCYFNYSHHPKTEGLSPLYSYPGTKGLVMHSTLAVTTEGLPLGIIHQKTYSRLDPSENITDLIKKPDHYKTLPIESKESYRWLEALKETESIFDGQNITTVTIGDRESDFYELFNQAESLNSKILVRAAHDRVVNKKTYCSRIPGCRLWDFLKQETVLGEIDIKVPKQKNKKARVATCGIRISKVKLTPPRKLKDNEIRPYLEMYAVYLLEDTKEPGVEPIEWMLLTNIPVTNLDEAIEKISWYCLRWRIETFHKILKSGLKVEDCRLSKADRLIRYLTVMSIIAWRIFYITHIGRVDSNISCGLLFTDIEWKILQKKFAEGKKSKKIPTLGKAIRWIAMLGGYPNRKSDGPPGIIYIWRGMKKLSNMLEGIELLKDIYG